MYEEWDGSFRVSAELWQNWMAYDQIRECGVVNVKYGTEAVQHPQNKSISIDGGCGVIKVLLLCTCMNAMSMHVAVTTLLILKHAQYAIIINNFYPSQIVLMYHNSAYSRKKYLSCKK